jgi:D-lyxose ketol-isomerase
LQSPVVNTIYSFVDRKATLALNEKSTTATELAKLYAHVQALPESAQKKKLVITHNFNINSTGAIFCLKSSPSSQVTTMPGAKHHFQKEVMLVALAPFQIKSVQIFASVVLPG